MKIQIENLKAQMRGVELNMHQRADALIEFNKLVEYTENLESKVENLGIHGVSESFADFGKILLNKDVSIEKNIDGFKRFVINGKMLQNTNKLYKKLSE